MATHPMIDRETIKTYLNPMTPLDTGIVPKLGDAGEIKAVLFDIYGTLFISGSGDIGVAKGNSKKTEGMTNLMSRFSIEGSATHLTDRLFSKIEKTHKELKEKGVDFPEVNIDQIWKELLNLDDMDSARAFAMEYELINNPVYPMPNLDEVLNALSNKNLLLGIVSNAQFYTPFLFEWFLGKTTGELGFHPELTIYSYRHNIAKPSRVLFTRASGILAGLGIPSGSALYIGNDMLNDIYPAKSEGFKTALFAGDKRSLRRREDDSRCDGIAPDFIVTDLIQLINLFA